MRWVLESGGGYRMGTAGVGRDGWVGTSKGTRCGGYTRTDMRAHRKYLHISHTYRPQLIAETVWVSGVQKRKEVWTRGCFAVLLTHWRVVAVSGVQKCLADFKDR